MARAQTTARPENVTVEELRHYLTEVEGKTATQRIMVGINHKEGIPQTKLADWYDVSRTTIHNWLNRLERLADEPLEDVIYDEERPGRPSKLDDEQRRQLRTALAETPTAVGYDAAEWSPKLVQSYVAEAFDVEYCLSYVRQLMNDIETPEQSVSDDIPSDASETDDSSSTIEDVAMAENPPTTDDEASQHRVHGCR
ncbi:MAG: helix-turn-helix domain-containing protein [Halorhabdus sp.]